MGGYRGRESKQLNLSISGNPITIFYPSATLLSTRDSLRIKGGVASVADSGASSQITAIQFAYILTVVVKVVRRQTRLLT